MSIQVTRAGHAPTYAPPGHTDVTAHRLHGAEAGGPAGFWVGHSVYPPGAQAELAPVAGDTVYVVLDGELTLTVTATKGADLNSASTDLRGGDSVYLPKGTVRSVENRSGRAATLLVIVQPGDSSS